MAEEDKKDELDNEQKDNADNKQEEQEDFVSPGVSGPSKGVLEKIANIFKKPQSSDETKDDEELDDIEGKTDDVDDKDEIDDTKPAKESDDEEHEYEEIDPRFIDIAGKCGWDNQRIVKYAESHSEQDLLIMSNLMQESVSKDKLKTDDSSDELKDGINEDELLKLAGDDPQLQAIIEKAIKPLAKRLETMSSKSDGLITELDSRKEREQLKEDIRNMEVANSVFDKSDILSLGKTDDMPRYPDGSFVQQDPAFQVRSKIYDVASLFYAKGGTFKDAMKDAMRWYKGEDVKKDIKKGVIKDLKKQEERVMPKRQEQKGEKTYATDEERKAAIINDALSKYNKELPA